MGSQLTKNYEVEREAKSEGGITGAWKIYSATRRDREKTPVSIFTFDKRILDKKANKQEVINKLKSEINTLIRLRHPNLLQILEPMLEDKTTIAWVTEPLEYCLGDLLRRPHILSNCLGDTETRLGILDVIQGLSFLHIEARLVHMALCPDNVYISLGGKWKIGGLNFAANYAQDSPAKLEAVDIIASAKSFRYQVEVDKIAPLLHFTAPELLNKQQATPAADIFSLGCSIFAIYKALSNTSSDLLLLEIDEFSVAGHMTACRNVSRNGNPALMCLPDTLPETVIKMLSISPADRSGLHELSISKSLQTPYVKTIYYLEHLQEKQDAQKMQFFKGLTTIIAKFDKVIMFKRLLPALVNNMHHPNLTPFILPSILTILKTCEVSKEMFQAQIWPSINKLVTGKEIPAQSFYLILSEIDLLVKYTESEACKKTLIPLVFKGYECGVPQIQNAIMDKTADLIRELADSIYVRQQLLPRFLQGIINSKTASVKETGLKVLSQIFSQFDRATMVDIIIPSLEKFKKFDITGQMVMHLLTVYEGISKALGHKATSINILPSLLPLLVEAELSKTEFERLFNSMIGMMHLIKDARAGELTDIKDEQIEENLKNEEIEEVNDIFKDIFDTGSKPIMEVRREENEKEALKKDDFLGFKQETGVEKKEVPSFGVLDSVKGFSFKSEAKPEVVKKQDNGKIDPFSLDFGKPEASKPVIPKHESYGTVETRKSEPPKADFFAGDSQKNEVFKVGVSNNTAIKDGFSQDFGIKKPDLAGPSKGMSLSKPSGGNPIIEDIFGDFSKKQVDNSVPKYNYTAKPQVRAENPQDIKPGSLKPPTKKPQNAGLINTDDFFNEFLSNPNKKDPFAGL